MVGMVCVCGGRVVSVWWACGGHGVCVWWACGGHGVCVGWACGGCGVGMWWVWGGHVVGVRCMSSSGSLYTLKTVSFFAIVLQCTLPGCEESRNGGRGGGGAVIAKLNN